MSKSYSCKVLHGLILFGEHSAISSSSLLISHVIHLNTLNKNTFMNTYLINDMCKQTNS